MLEFQRNFIVGNLCTMFGNVRVAVGLLLENVWKSSYSSRKSSENRQKHSYHNTRLLVDMAFLVFNFILLLSCTRSWDVKLNTRG